MLSGSQKITKTKKKVTGMLEVQKLTKYFGDTAVLENIRCSIPGGCIYGLVVSNGA